MATAADFAAAVEFVLRHEGGYVNDPSDPGGETKYGISKRAYPSLNIAALTREQAVAIYERDYWRASGAPSLPMPLALVVFDTAVNMGVTRARQLLAESRGDVDRLLQLRRVAYENIAAGRPASQKFLAGWLRRVDALARRVGPVGGAGLTALAIALAFYLSRR